MFLDADDAAGKLFGAAHAQATNRCMGGSKRLRCVVAVATGAVNLPLSAGFMTS